MIQTHSTKPPVNIQSYTNFEDILKTYVRYNEYGRLLDGILALDDVIDAASWPGSETCTHGGTIDFSGQRNASTISGGLDEKSEYIKYEFNNCELDDHRGLKITVSGTYEQTYTGVSKGSTLIAAQTIEKYDLSGNFNDHFVSRVEPFNLSAQVVETTEGGTLYEEYSVERRMIPFEFRTGSHYLALSDMTLTSKSRPGTFDPVLHTQDGRIISSWLSGFVVHVTDTVLSTPTNKTCPTEGVLQFIDENNGVIEVRYLDDTNTGHGVTAEINENGVPRLLDDCEDMSPGNDPINIILPL